MTYPFNQIPSTNPQNIGIPTPIGLQTAARNPTPQDNTYVPGSEWQNSVTRVFYKCVSSTVAGAVWTPFIPSTAGTISTLTANSGGAVGPDGMGNVNVIGDGTSILIAGNAGTNTLTASLVGGGVAAQSFPTDLNSPVVPTAAGVLNFTGSTTTYTNGVVANTIHTEVQGTDHAVFIGKGALTPATTIAVGTNGQVIVGATGADPAFATLTSPDSSITFTPGANSLALTVTGGATVGQTITGDSGGALPPTAGNWNIVGGTVAAGTSPLVTAGAGSTLTINAQRSQAIAAGDSTKIGMCNFDSSTFAVSAAGFVTLVGGIVGATSFPVDASTAPGTNPVLPTGGGALTIIGTTVAAHAVPLRTDSLAANTINVEVQRASTSATTNSTAQGVASFSSSFFTADANGWVTLGPTSSTGSWTPNLQFGGASVGLTYAVRFGKYQQIGNLVYFSLTVQLTNKGVSAGIATISNLPVAPGVANINVISTAQWTGITFSAGFTYMCGLIIPVGSRLDLDQCGSVVAATQLTNTNFANNSAFSITGYYFAD